MALVVSELLAADIPTRIQGALDAVTHDATDPNWQCAPASPFILPGAEELQRVADEGIERIILISDGAQIVGLTTIDATGRLRWMILDTAQFADLLTLLCEWIVATLKLVPWGVVAGDNQRLAAMIAHPRVIVEDTVDNGGAITTVVRWS